MPTVPAHANKETDLYPPIHDYLVAQGYTVRSEVKHCDVAAVKGEDLVIIEMKRSLGLPLLAQAVERQKLTDSVYVAIPRPSNVRKWLAQSRGSQMVLRRLELGLILVSPNSSRHPVEIILHPAPYARRKRKRAQMAVLKEIESRTVDLNQGGSCRRKLVTGYRENAIHIACCLDQHGPLSPKCLRNLGTGPKTQSILLKNHYSWFDHLDKGVYGLSERGKSELVMYPELAQHYRGLLVNEEKAPYTVGELAPDQGHGGCQMDDDQSA